MPLNYVMPSPHSHSNPPCWKGIWGIVMLNNYFFDQNGFEQKDEVKREKAVAAVLEILKVSAGHAATHVTVTALKNEVSEAADALQKALDNK